MRRVFCVGFLLMAIMMVKQGDVWAACSGRSSCNYGVSSCGSFGRCSGSGSCPGGVCCYDPYCSQQCLYGCNKTCGGGTCKPAPTSPPVQPTATKKPDNPTPTKLPTPAGGCSSITDAIICGYGCYWYNNRCNSVAPTIYFPSLTPTPKPVTPTLACDQTLNDCNPLENSGCRSVCDVCEELPTGVIKVRTKSGNCFSSQACRDDKKGPCYVYFNIPDAINCGYCRGEGTYPSVTPFCQVFACYGAPNAVCPGFNPATSCAGAPYYGVGRCDNCGGMDCGSCGGGAGAATPVPTKTSCLPDCLNPAISTCIANTCFDQTCLGNCNQYCYGSKNSNCGSECSNYSVGTTYASPNGCGTCSGCNRFPQFITGSLIIKNSDGVLVPGESGGTNLRNHICQITFQNSTLPRRARFEVSVTDGDGWSDIVETGSYIRWNSVNYPLLKLSGSGLGGTMYANIDFPVANPATEVEDIYLTVVDSSGGTTGQADSLRDFKAWDCLVGVSGGIFDGSVGAVCAGSGPTTPGYTTYVGDGFNFKSLRFSRSDDNNLKYNMTVSGAATYSSPVDLVWGRSYLNLETDFNYNDGEGPIEGTFSQVRISGGSVNGFICGPSLNLSSDLVIDPYSSSNSLVVDYSSTVNQDPWWQVEGGGIKMFSTIRNMVPITCSLDGGCREAMSVDDIVLNNSNGLVSAVNILNNSGCGDLCRIGLANNHYYTGNLLNKTFSYNVLRQEYLLKYNEGIEVGNNWVDDISENTSDKVFFVNGDLLIDSNLILLPNEFKMVIVSGTITIYPTVTRLDGIYLANNGFVIGGGIDSPLEIQGILHTSGGDVSIIRYYVDKSLNNTNPAVIIKYRPDIIFSMPTNLTRALSGWKGGI